MAAISRRERALHSIHSARSCRRPTATTHLSPIARTVFLAGVVAWTGAPAAADEVVAPGAARWGQVVAPAALGLDPARLQQARDYALTSGGSGMILRSGAIALTWGDLTTRYDLKSSTKSFGATALGLAIADGKMTLDDLAREHHPTLGIPPESNAETGWLAAITLRHLATQTAGFDKPGGYVPLLFRPGTRWHYSDAGPNWLAECITLAYRRDVAELMFERVFEPLGITRADLTWRRNAYRPAEIDGIPRREFGSGISANVGAMARIGQLYLNGGRWGDRQILPREFVDQARTAAPDVVGLPVDIPEDYGAASGHYGLLWWNNADGTLPGVPRDAFWSWGLYDSLIVVIPSFDIVIARAGRSWARTEGADHYAVLEPFLGKIAASVRTAAVPPEVPCPPSRAIVGVDWAPASDLRRAAPGSDNWPLAWADDGYLYTAYGDGRGFEPFAPRKLSLGLARVEGPPDEFHGVNLPAPTLERLGDGPKGEKASGLLMVGGRLYLWARNAGNARLAWSDDHGKTWTWADWRLTDGFGCPSFLNFGPNYAGARDEYVYLYSHDAETAYEAADRVCLARVPRDHVLDRDAYEFFEHLDSTGQPVWTAEITRRGPVFSFSGNCYRTTASYNAGLGRYLLSVIRPDEKMELRFAGGFGLYDAPEPWGPWTAVYVTDRWDVGPGETQSFPPKWMSPDGTTAHLVFSGEDAFSVRRATFLTAPPGEK